MMLARSRANTAAVCRQARSTAFTPLRPVRARLAVRAQKQDAAEAQAFEVGKFAALSAVASTWMCSGQAQAAAELANVAAGDNRLGTISLLFLPALGWVAFNILQPAFNQLNRMNELKDKASTGGGRKKRAVAGGVGLGAALSLFAAQQADAATELSQLAASDNRLATISLLFLPALGWVAFNMLQPASNQLDRMNELKEEAAGAGGGRRKRAVAGGVGLGAALSMFAAQQADAATELSQLAASDNRLATISLLFLPALGWVAFNILQPAFNQLSRMNELKEETKGSSGRKKRAVAGGVGLGAALSLFAAQQADAATELSQLAASDNRLATISLLFLPALGWVAFNMLQPASNQLDRMNELKEEAAGAGGGRRKRAVAGGVGLGAALSLFAAQQADAATELSQLAASDNRLATISLLFLPALGWVAFNMLQPASNQLDRMNELKEAASSGGRSGRR